MATDSYLILTVTPAAAGDAHRYVQFAQAGPTGLRAEAVGNGFLPGPDRLTPAQEAALLALGWCYKRLDRIGDAIDVLEQAALIDEAPGVSLTRTQGATTMASRVWEVACQARAWASCA